VPGDFQPKAQNLIDTIAKLVTEFTNETGAVLTYIGVTPTIEPLGEDLKKVNYQWDITFGEPTNEE